MGFHSVVLWVVNTVEDNKFVPGVSEVYTTSVFTVNEVGSVACRIAV